MTESEHYDHMVEDLASDIEADTGVSDIEVFALDGWEGIIRKLHNAGYSVTHDVTVEKEE